MRVSRLAVRHLTSVKLLCNIGYNGNGYFDFTKKLSDINLDTNWQDLVEILELAGFN